MVALLKRPRTIVRVWRLAFWLLLLPIDTPTHDIDTIMMVLRWSDVINEKDHESYSSAYVNSITHVPCWQLTQSLYMGGNHHHPTPQMSAASDRHHEPKEIQKYRKKARDCNEWFAHIDAMESKARSKTVGSQAPLHCQSDTSPCRVGHGPQQNEAAILHPYPTWETTILSLHSVFSQIPRWCHVEQHRRIQKTCMRGTGVPRIRCQAKCTREWPTWRTICSLYSDHRKGKTMNILYVGPGVQVQSFDHDSFSDMTLTNRQRHWSCAWCPYMYLSWCDVDRLNSWSPTD